MKKLLLILLLTLPSIAFAQTQVLNETFDDGDFTNNPEWTGDTGEFTIFDNAGNNQLRLNDTDASNTSSFLVTPSTTAYGSWEFFIDQDFSPSDNNRAFIFLMADNDELTSVNGYAIRAGENGSTDRFRLYRFTNGSATEVLAGTLDLSAGGPFQVRVSRDENGNWELFESSGYGSTPTSAATATDNTHTTSSYFGIQTNYTSTRSENFYFDDIIITNTEDFAISSASGSNSQAVDVTFNYQIDNSTIDPSNFVLSGIGSPQQTELINSDLTVRLTFTNDISSGDYTLTVNNVENIYGGTITTDSEIELTFSNPFELTGSSSPQDNQAFLEFNEDINFTTVETTDFTVNGEAIDPATNITQPETNQLLLEFPQNLPSGLVQVEVTGFESVNGWNIPGGTVAEFFIYDEYQPGDIVINEFMKDPPDGTAEYVELKNTSSRYLNLKDWEIGDDNGIITITGSDFAILPDSFAVISADTSVLNTFYGDANYVQASLPALNNGADQIRVFDNNSTLADSLEYSSDWGGVDVAIERRDASVSSTFIENWGDSPSEDFGTPGFTNLIAEDQTPPEISELLIENSQTIVLFVSERLENTSAETIGNYSLSQNPESGATPPAIPSISSATQIAADSVELSLDSSLEEYDGSWILTADNLTDIFGNSTSDAAEFTFTNPFTITEVSTPADNEILILFGEEVDFSSVSVADFAVNGEALDGSSTITQPGADQILIELPVVLPSGPNLIAVSNIQSVTGWNIPQNTEFEFFVFDEYQPGDIVINEFMKDPPTGTAEYVEIKNISSRYLNLKDWVIGDNSSVTSVTDQDFVVFPDSFAVITADTAVLNSFYGEANYVQASLPALNNSGDQVRIFDDNGTLADSLEYTSDWGGEEVSIERRDASVSSTFIENWGDSPSENFGTPGFTNLVTQDEAPPGLSSIERIGTDQIQLTFTERLQETQAEDPANFSLSADNISGVPTLQSATFSSPGTILLQYDTDFPSDPAGTTYQLTIADQADIFANTASDTTASFFVIEYAVADSGQIFITEFMSDPATGFTDLIELYNPTENAYNLEGWTFNDDTGNRRVIIENEFALPPDSRVVLAPENTIAESFPDITLINMGTRFSNLNSTTADDIVIRNQSGTLIDSLTYTPEWGGNELSLERRSTDISAVFRENWGDSPSENFATPGTPNEVSPDITPPEIASLTILDDSTFQVIFTERVLAGPATVESNYTLSEPDGLPSAPPALESVTFSAPDTVIISYPSALPKQEQGSEYGLIIENQSDIFGNVAASLEDSFFLIDITQAEPGDVVINEFMYDPGTEFSEFIELYNPSDKNFDLQGWTLNDNTGNRRVITDVTVELITGSYVILAPDSTVISLFPDREIIVMGSRFSALNNGSDDIVIRNNDGTQIDSLTYFSEWGGSEVSLERRSAGAASFYMENWGDSPSAEGATPGAPNEIQPDNSPPELSNAFIAASDSIRLIFSERVDSVLAKNASNYSISPSVSIAEIAGFSGNSLTVVLGSSLTDGETYSLTIEDQEDIFGNVQASISSELEYTEFSPAQFGDVIVNEILYRRERADSEEFVELYNPTDRNFNLSNWTLSDAVSSATIPEGTEIRSGEYVVLTDRESFADGLQNGVYLSGFPSLNDDEDAVVIRNQQGSLIDSLFYNETWGGNEDGVSLERKDPESGSNDASNWASSTSDSGTSASDQSSTFEPDETVPEILFSKLQSDGTIFVAFTEFVNIDNASAFVNGEQVAILNYNETQANIVILENPVTGSSSSLAAKTGRKASEPLNLTFSDITDFRGNANQELAVEVSQPITPSAVVINEILYNPLDNPDDNLPDQTEYVELYNPSDVAVSLEGFFLHDEPDEDGEVRSLAPVSSQYKWVPAGGYVVVYAEDQATTFGESQLAEYFEIENESDQFKVRIDRTSLSLTNSDDAIYLADSTGATIDSVFYDESWQNPNLYDNDGVALERIDPSGPSNDPSNWSSSTRVNGGTPGEQNSIFQEGGSVSENTGITFTPNPFSPDDDGFEDNLFINYKLDESDYLLRVRIFDRYGREVKELADGLQAGFEGSLIWDGRTDDNRSNRVGIYIVLFEAYNSANGKNVTFKETVVLARKF